MPTPIETTGATGLSLYAVSHHPDGRVWNTTLNSGLGGWEAYNGGHWAQYAIALTEQGTSGYYRGTYPAAISGVLTSEVIYANGTPTLGDAPYAGPAQSQGANVAAVAGDAAVPAKMQASLSSMVLGAVIAGTLEAAAFTTDVTNSNVNAYAGRSLYFTTGDLAGQGSTITGYDPDSGTITVAGAFTGAPSADDVFIIA
ncbi:MAG: hypothetical protein V4510_10000 [bacterium]